MACEQAQSYADQLYTARMENLALRTEVERLHKERRDLKVLLAGKMPMTALDYLNLNEHSPTHH
jgi:hypothetical protein